jgi:hypothetical protein
MDKQEVVNIMDLMDLIDEFIHERSSEADIDWIETTHSLSSEIREKIKGGAPRPCSKVLSSDCGLYLVNNS